MSEPTIDTVILHDIHDLRHLEEDQNLHRRTKEVALFSIDPEIPSVSYPMPCRFQFRENPIQEFKFAGAAVE